MINSICIPVCPDCGAGQDNPDNACDTCLSGSVSIYRYHTRVMRVSLGEVNRQNVWYEDSSGDYLLVRINE